MGSVLGAVQVNHMNQLGTGVEKLLCGLHRVLRDLVRRGVVALDQTHAHLIL